MQIYLAIYLFWAFMAMAARKRSHSMVLAALFALFVAMFAGTRDEVGCDFRAYALRFEYLYQGLDWWEGMWMTEGGFNLLNILMRDMGFGINAVFMAAAAIYAACMLRFSTLAPRPLAWMVVAFPILVLQLGMSGVRQALATAFLMLAYHAFVQRRTWWVLGWIVVASLFHQSAIILLPIAALARRQVSLKRLIVATIILSPLAGWLIGERLQVYNDRYVDQIYGENSADGAWFRYAILMVPFLLLEWKRKLVRDAFPDLFPLLRLCSLIGFSLLAAGLVSSVALHRMVFYVLPVSLLALCCVSRVVFARGQSARFGMLLPFLMYGLYISVWFMLSAHSASCYVPYRSWLL